MRSVRVDAYKSCNYSRSVQVRVHAGTNLGFYVQEQIQGQTSFFNSRFNISHTLKILQIFFKTLFLFFNFP